MGNLIDKASSLDKSAFMNSIFSEDKVRQVRSERNKTLTREHLDSIETVRTDNVVIKSEGKVTSVEKLKDEFLVQTTNGDSVDVRGATLTQCLKSKKPKGSRDFSSNSNSSSSNGNSTETVSGDYKGTKHKATDDQLKALTNACIQENGSSESAIKGEASLMCNLYEKRGKSYSSIYSYVRNGKWFGEATRKAMDSNKHNPSAQQIAWVKDVICNGNHTLPSKINEHDCYSDISWIKNDGKKYTSRTYISNSSNYHKDKTVVHNRYGSTWTFYCYLRSGNGGDPYGYTG